MKRLYAFLGLFLAVVVLSAASCDSDNNANTENSNQTSENTSEESNNTGVDVNVGANVTTGKTVTITHNGSAFSPANVTVKAGDTVKFVSNSSTPVWPASAPHPTHTDLPGFDSKSGIANGATYSFTFTQKGTWKFHNHLNPSQFGSVVVE